MRRIGVGNFGDMTEPGAVQLRHILARSFIIDLFC
jgi:hypothetical protein